MNGESQHLDGPSSCQTSATQQTLRVSHPNSRTARLRLYLAKSLNFSDGTTNAQSSSMLSLPNGCLCCSFKDMGIAAIEEMVAAQKDQIDWVLVELTGVADPGECAILGGCWHGVLRLHTMSLTLGPIAKSFWGNEEMGDLILDGIVCVVDCRNILKVSEPLGYLVACEIVMPDI